MKQRRVYRVIFHNQGSVYELYARRVGQGELYTFVEVEDIIFGERGGLLVDPSEEKLKSEFAGATRTYIPLPSVVRIDEVEKEGVNKIVPAPPPQEPATRDHPRFPVIAGSPAGYFLSTAIWSATM